MFRNTLGALVLTIGTVQAATVSTVSDLAFIVGEGENQSNLVLDFNNGSGNESFAWGYRYDGMASGADMLIAIAAADDNLDIVASGDGDDGFFLMEITYLGNEIVPVQNAFWSYSITGGFAGDIAANNGMVDTAVAIAGGGDALPDSWTTSPSGASTVAFGDSGRLLTNGSWDAWSYGAFGTAPGPEAIEAAVAVPEPSSLLFGILSLGFAASRRRR